MIRKFLAWAFQPPKWARECQAVFDAWSEENRQFDERMERSLKALRGSTPPPVQGTDPFLPE
jgi:hypothetical protein